MIAGPTVGPAALRDLQAAFTDAVADPALAGVRATLLVDAFETRSYADYLPLRSLAPAPH